MADIVLTLIIVLVLDGFVSATEAAFFSTPLNRARFLVDENKRGAKTLLELKLHTTGPITTLLALSNILTLVGGVFIGAQTAEVYGSEAVGLMAGIFTVVIMIFAEIIPKRIGERMAEKFMLPSAPILKVITVVFAPLVWLIQLLARPFSVKRSPPISEAEIMYLARLGSDKGLIEKDESVVIQNVFKLNDMVAEDIMIPRAHVVFLSGDKKLNEVKDKIIPKRHSRIPVLTETGDRVIGIVYQIDLLSALTLGEGESVVGDYIRQPLCVMRERPLDDLVRDFHQHGTRLAVVTDKGKKAVGVVGLEDVLETLVGSTPSEPG